MTKPDYEPQSASFDLTQLSTNSDKNISIPDKVFNVRDTFGIDVDLEVPGFENDKNPHVPKIDESYIFDTETTLALLAGFAHNRRVMVQGYHGTGKSTHIEQVAARLNWPCVRINLDSHVSRLDLLGKDMIVLKEGKQITEYKEGLLPWALQNPVALVFDEYDAGRPDVMFVIQRVLEAEGRLTLLDQNKVIRPHPAFRLFATSNTVGLGDSTGLYHGTQQLNQGQMDRWNIVTVLNYLSHDVEVDIVSAKAPDMDTKEGREEISAMVRLASLTREGFQNGDLSIVMSPRTVMSWLENMKIFGDRDFAFKLSFLNKADEIEHAIIAEYYQRCFGVDLLSTPQEDA
jgi:cobaltochelatase CobS